MFYVLFTRIDLAFPKYPQALDSSKSFVLFFNVCIYTFELSTSSSLESTRFVPCKSKIASELSDKYFQTEIDAEFSETQKNVF